LKKVFLNTNMTEDKRDWEKMYHEEAVEEMPWFYPGLDPDLVGALEGLGITAGSILDLCTGPGTQAMKLAERGFEVTAFDISKTAVKKAHENAKKKGLDIEFVEKDFLAGGAGRTFDFVFDRGCFHTLSPELRGEYLKVISKLIRPGGYLFLKCFSHREKMEGGPYRFTPEEIRGYFSGPFDVLSIEETVYHGTLKPLPIALFCVMRKT